MGEKLQDERNRQRGVAAAVTILILAGIIFACANQATAPMPLVSKAADAPALPKDQGSPVIGVPVAPLPSGPGHIIAQRGQSLNGIKAPLNA